MDGSTDSNWLDNVRALADELGSTFSDSALQDELVQLLENWQASRDEVDTAYSMMLSFFLGTLQDKGINTDVVQLTAKMIEARTSGGGDVSYPAVTSVEKHLDVLLQSLGQGIQPGGSSLSSVIKQASAEGPVAERRRERRKSGPPPGEPSNYQWTNSTNGQNGQAEGESAESEVPTQPKAEEKVNTAYRMHLNRKHGEIDKLQEELSQKAMEAINQNKEFGSMLEIERSALQQASSATEIEQLKQILIGGTDELIHGQRQLSEKLKGAFEYLQLVKSDSEQLHEELHKVRLLSLTDEFTGLPNRRAFVRRLEDEISRVGRYNIPLTLAIIDLDHFKQINDKYGHPVGDAVLNWYALNALPTFRHYDMVARYGGEEFAVLFPNTTYDGGLRALVKMRRRIEYARCEAGGHTVKVPTFSAGLTAYEEGDTQETLIQRADEALYKAKNRGRDRIELNIPDSVREALEAKQGKSDGIKT